MINRMSNWGIVQNESSWTRFETFLCTFLNSEATSWAMYQNFNSLTSFQKISDRSSLASVHLCMFRENLCSTAHLQAVNTCNGNGGVCMDVPQDSISRLHSFEDQNICPTRVSGATKCSQIRCFPRFSTLAYNPTLGWCVDSSCLRVFSIFSQIFTSLSLPDFPDSTLPI